MHPLHRSALSTQNGRMKISEEQLQEFVDIYEREFGVTLDKQAANEEAQHVLNLLRALGETPCSVSEGVAG